MARPGGGTGEGLAAWEEAAKVAREEGHGKPGTPTSLCRSRGVGQPPSPKRFLAAPAKPAAEKDHGFLWMREALLESESGLAETSVH